MAEVGPILLHSIAPAIMIWGFRELATLDINDSIVIQKGGHWQFLTIQGLAAACITLLFGLLADLFPYVKGFRKTQRVLQMVSLPIAVIVTIIYWGLLLLFPGLILPPAPGTTDTVYYPPTHPPPLARIPLSMDLALHAAPVIALTIDFIIFQRPYSEYEIKYGAPLFVTLAALWYSSWVEYWATLNGTFPYPFLTDNIFEVRVVIYLSASLLALATFRGLNKVHPRVREKAGTIKRSQ